MPGLWNISSNLNIDTKKIMSKLSFETGEVFTARIINVDKIKGELTLKLLEGWQFLAKVNNDMDIPVSGLNKFVVEGFEQGQLKIKILNSEEHQSLKKENLVVTTLNKQKVNISNQDYKMLENMIKHSMPLTKENITLVKSILEFKTAIQEEPQKKETFINKFLESKGVDLDSPKGVAYSNKLRNFFTSITSISDNEILTLMENDLELNQENIKSFKHVFKDSKTIYEDLHTLSREINKLIPEKNSNTVTLRPEQKESGRKLQVEKPNTVILEPELQEKVIKLQNNRIADLSNKFKEEIRTKTDEIKNVAKQLISNINTSDGSSTKYEDIVNLLGRNINDFKVFNTVSNQYYYFDLPVKIENFDYECKLIIKDERKKERKIDSNDVKIATSIKTKNMGTVDSYITVKNNNMNIDIKSDKSYINILSFGSDLLMKELSELRYNITIEVKQIEKPLNLVDSRDFFQDNELGNINVTV